MSDLTTVYISIGNSDDKLSQARWHDFWSQVTAFVHFRAAHVHGEWLSAPAAPWQNGCICADVRPEDTTRLKTDLQGLAAEFGQDSIAWAEAEVEFLVPPE